MELFNLIRDLSEIAPENTAEHWDNSGLQVGNLQADINSILLALDINNAVLETAIKDKHNLIITHHPFIFNPLKNIDLLSEKGKIIKKLIENNINLYSMHTNLDIAIKGVNEALAEAIGINNYEILHNLDNNIEQGYGGIGQVKEYNIFDYALKIKENLGCPYVRVYSNNKTIKRVAFCGGSGSSFILDAANKKADVYVTGDIKYHDVQLAMDLNLGIIDAGHYYTEIPVLKFLNKFLKAKNNNLIVKNFTTNTISGKIL